jgi:hypothetical protein
MPRSRGKLLLAAALLAAPVLSRADADMTIFPRSGELYAPQLADPREIQLAITYYRLHGHDASDIALGHSWGMARWGAQGDWRFQWDVEAMAMSRFNLAGSVNEFQTVDFYGNLPLEIRRGDASARFMLFHQSSHLGDDYIRRTGITGFRYSIEGLKGALSYDLFAKALRLYVDGIYLMHSVPAPERGSAGVGAELQSPAFAHLSKDLPLSAYLAWDVQSRAHVRWNLDSSTQVGLRLRFREETRSMRLFWAYFDGHSPYGEFYTAREHYSELGLAFDF